MFSSLVFVLNCSFLTEVFCVDARRAQGIFFHLETATHRGQREFELKKSFEFVFESELLFEK